MHPLAIRSARPADLDTIVRFNQFLAEETEGRRLPEPRLRAGVETALARPDLCRYFLAERAGQVVGQTMVTFEWSDWRCGLFWWLQSVYVPPAHRRQGVFRGLLQHVRRQAEAEGNVCGLRLYVERKNAAAMRVYESLGLANAGYLVFEHDQTHG